MTHALAEVHPIRQTEDSRVPIRVLELRSVRGTGGGPDKTILLGAARSDPARFQVTVCYIRDLRDREFRIGERAAEMGVDYVEIAEKHSFDPGIWRALRALVRERHIDILHAHEHKTDLLALLLARAEGVIPLATAHGWSGLTARERFYYFFDRRLLCRYPMVVAVSEVIRRTLLQHGADPSRVRRILNGIDPDDFRKQTGARDTLRAALGIPAHALVAGTLGRLEEIKRFDVLLEAFAQLRGPGDGFLLIAGEGSNRSALEARAAALGVGGRVLFLGQRHDIRDVHQVFDVYVQSSDSEGIPNSVLEAMALETPVVATDVGGTCEIIEDGVHGLLVPPGNPGALARAIERTIGDPSATAERVARARRRIEEELSFAVRMTALERLYEELMATYRPAASSAHAVA